MPQVSVEMKRTEIRDGKENLGLEGKKKTVVIVFFVWLVEHDRC